MNQRDYEEDEYYEDWDKEDTEQLPVEQRERRFHALAARVMDNPRLTLGGGSLLLSFALDIAIRFDPLVIILGLGAAAAITVKGEDLATGTMKLLVPGSDTEQARESADYFADRALADYPIYADQSALAKIRRLFKLEEGEVVDALPQKRGSLPKKQDINQRNGNVVNMGGEGLTFERITAWFDDGRIDDTQFFALLERIDNPKSAASGHRNGNGNGAKDEHEEASEDAVSPQMEPLRPQEWSEEKEFQLIGAFLATRHLDNSLKALSLSTSQRNRDFARDTLKQRGLWKEK